MTQPAVRIQRRFSWPATVKAGTPVDLVIKATDTLGNVDTGFVGSVALSDDDPTSDLVRPVATTAADLGTKTVQVTLGALGERTVSASSGTLAGTASTTVVAGAPYGIALATSGGALTGVCKSVQVAVVDKLGNPVDDPAAPYLGTVTFTLVESPPAPPPTLPAPYTFTADDNSRRPTSLRPSSNLNRLCATLMGPRNRCTRRRAPARARCRRRRP